MRSKIPVLIAVALATSFAVFGCSESPVEPAGGTTAAAGLFDGEIDPGAGDFEFLTRRSNDPGRPTVGPFIIRGRNVHYDDAIGALVVDLLVQNAGRVAHHEPIGLTFLNLLPDDVTVLNPDNDEHGNGAAIRFEFENDDAMWTPGEQSLPRTVHFGVAAGTAIGFVARLDIGMEPRGGSIRGLVWNDTNKNGEIDPDENGIGGVTIALLSGDTTDLANAIKRTRTAHDGQFWFEGLRPGFYTVMKTSLREYMPTTPSVLHVLLTETDDGVSDFLMANFGCVKQEYPDMDVLVGDYVEVTGDFHRDDFGRIVARLIEVEHIDDRMMGPYILRKSELRGPVTDIHREERRLAVMGTWVQFAKQDSTSDSTAVEPHGGDGSVSAPASELRFEDVEIGDRVWVVVMNMRNHSDEALMALALREWDDSHDKVHGYVERRGGPDGRPTELVVLRTRVMVTPDTEIVPLYHVLP